MQKKGSPDRSVLHGVGGVEKEARWDLVLVELGVGDDKIQPLKDSLILPATPPGS